jgi:hypothetical protein
VLLLRQLLELLLQSVCKLMQALAALQRYWSRAKTVLVHASRSLFGCCISSCVHLGQPGDLALAAAQAGEQA